MDCELLPCLQTHITDDVLKNHHDDFGTPKKNKKKNSKKLQLGETLVSNL